MIDIIGCMVTPSDSQHVENHYFHGSDLAIIEDIRLTYFYEMRIVVIYNRFERKCNVYWIDYMDHLVMTDDPKEIVANGSPVLLRKAQEMFPQYEFDETNYGF